MFRPAVALLSFAACAALLCACAASPATGGPARVAGALPSVQIASAAEVSHCAALPTVVGTNAQPVMENGMLAAQSFGSARAAVLTKAQAEGATHVVWGDEIVGGAGSFVTARPYRCDRLAAR